jgi:hypothetical protein
MTAHRPPWSWQLFNRGSQCRQFMMGVAAVCLGIGMSGQAHSEIGSNVAIGQTAYEGVPQTMEALAGRSAAFTRPGGNATQNSRLFDQHSKLVR